MHEKQQRSPAPEDLPSNERHDERSSRPDDGGRDGRSGIRHISGSSRDSFVNGFSGRGRVNGLKSGRINGLINGFTNGRINGLRNGRINGLVNGFTNGRINGLRNGKWGLTNGLVNGLDRKTGLVNGNGFINGFRMAGARRGIPLARRNSPIRMAIVMAVVALVVIVPFLLVYSMPVSAIKIDGYFFDWDRAGYFHESLETAAPEIDIRDYSVVTWQNTVYGYMSTAEPMFMGGNTTPTSLFAFVDLDNDPGTGYILGGMGADVKVEIMGWNGSAKSATATSFAPYSDRHDYSGFLSPRPAEAMSDGNRVEFSFGEMNEGEPTVRFLAKNYAGWEDESQYAIRFGEGALRVVSDLSLRDIVPADSLEKAMNLEFESQRGDFTITSLAFQKLGDVDNYRISVFDDLQVLAQSTGPTLAFLPALEIKEGYGKKLALYVEIDGGEVQSTFGLALNESGVRTSSGPVSVEERQSFAKVAYVEQIPHSVIIDGAFADWANGYVMIDRANDVQLIDGNISKDGSIDILEYGMYLEQTDVAMYLSTADRICNGTLIPKNIQLPVPTQGLPNIESKELIGSDVAGALIDTDTDISTGVNVRDIIGADYFVFIAGKKGDIIISELYSWDAHNNNGTWEFVRSVISAVDSRRMEFAFNMSDLSMGDLDVAAVEFFMTDWQEGGDFSDSLLPLAKWQAGLYKRAFGGIIINEVKNNKGTTDWIELYNTGSTPITLTGWIIYDGTTAIYTFGAITINPGEFLVISGLSISKTGSLRLANAGGLLIDSVIANENSKSKTYGRTGDPPYSKWKELMPTPGALNPGQVAIPEFSDILVPVVGIIGVFALVRFRGRRGRNE